MATKDTNSAGQQQFFDATKRLMDLNPALSMGPPPIEQMLENHDKVVDDIETYAHAWCERRHEANREALEAMKSLSHEGKGDISAAMKVMNDWMTQSIARMSEDARDAAELYTRCMTRLAAAQGTIARKMDGDGAAASEARQASRASKSG